MNVAQNYQALPAAPNANYGPDETRFKNRFTTPTGAKTPGATSPPPGYGGNFPPSTPRATPDETRFAQAPQKILDFMATSNKLPAALTNQDLAYMRQQGLDPSQMAQFYTFDPKTGSYVLNPDGQSINKSAAAPGGLQYGQYLDPATGEVKRGTTPFGTNAAGQRLDAGGNVWDPKTAKKDIYGGQFIQVGETRWERNKNGRLVKVRYGKGGKKTVVSGKGGGKGGHNTPPQTSQPAAPEAPVSQATSVNFNTASG